MNLRQYLARAKRAIHQKIKWRRDEQAIWDSLLHNNTDYWNIARQAAKGGPRVLMATSMGGFEHGALTESALAVALTLRGAQVDVLLCDSFLPGCQLTKISNTPPEQLFKQGSQRCETCYLSGKKIFDPLGLPIYWYGQMVTPEQVETARRIAGTIPVHQAGEYTLDGLAVGEHALAGALRYFARGSLDGEPEGEKVLRRYLEASILSVYAIQALLERNAYSVACFNHGIYVPQGLIGEVCRRRGVRVVNWNPAYRRHCFIFSHEDTYHHTMISESTSVWENITWSPDLEKKTLNYLKSRWQGTQDWIWFHEKPQEDVNKIAQEIGVDFSRPCIGMLTSVMWDAQLHYRSNAFQNQMEWVLQTISYFSKRPELQLIIRIHPAEVRGMIASRQPIHAEIKQAFPVLPSNVFVIPPESQVSTYAVVEKCNSVIIYNTKTGIEISSMGIPVIVAGEAWIRNKGFSIDASSPTEYFRILDRLPLSGGLSAEHLERARKYAFHFFYRRMIPLLFIKSDEESRFAVELSDIKELQPGNYPGLDMICEGILDGTPFIYPAERLP